MFLESFRDFYNKKILNEGGNAIKSSRPVNKQEFELLMDDFYKNFLRELKIKKENTTFLGSTGKKDLTNDIDIALDINEILKNNNNLKTLDDIYNFIISICEKKGIEYNDLRAINLISIGYNIPNTNDVAQVDLMLVDDIDYASWSYYSPSQLQSQWKGLYRNELLFAIAKYAQYEVIKAQNVNGEEIPVEWKRIWYDLSKGLLQGVQTRIGKRGDIVKTVKTVNKVLLTKNKDEIVKILFGDYVKAENILTWEDAWSAIHHEKFRHKKYLKDIYKMTAEGILKKGYPLSKELEEKINGI